MMPVSLTRIFTVLASKTTGSERCQSSTDWAEKLCSITHLIDRILAESEEEFLDIGEKLRGFYSNAQEMCTQSGAVVEIMTGESLSQAIDGLATIMNELRDHLQDLDSHFDKIMGAFEEHLKALGNISSHMEDLNLLVLNLSMLGFLTQVENAHIISHDSGFSSLTEDVRRLADNIKEKSHHISMVSINVRNFITHALGKIVVFEKSQGESARITHEHAEANYHALTKKNESASASARLIEQKSKDIASNISDIILSMQFHDITRQQIGHVKEVFDHLCVRLKDDGHDGMEQAAVVRDILTLQRAQLKQSEDDLASAVLQIIDNLQTIATSVNKILSETHDVAWASETEGLSFMDDLDNGISSVIECIGITADEQARLTETVTSASEMVSEMSVFVQDIEALGLRLQLIALNARIKAAHLGKEGTVLDIISGGIYELSRNARQDTVTLTEILANLVNLSISFKEELISIQDKQSQAVSLMVNKLKEIITSLHDINDKVRSMLADMTSLGESLVNDIRTTADHITVHEDVRKVLNDAITVVEEITGSARLICPSGRNTEAASFLASIDELYTMKSERDIHLQHLDTLPTGDYPGTSDTGDDLGDNVELF